MGQVLREGVALRFVKRFIVMNRFPARRDVRHSSSVKLHPPLNALAKLRKAVSLTTLREKLIKIGAKVVSHGRYATFQMAEVAVPRELFRKILSLIDDLRRRPAPA